jgi:hypothetical protein
MASEGGGTAMCGTGDNVSARVDVAVTGGKADMVN